MPLLNMSIDLRNAFTFMVDIVKLTEDPRVGSNTANNAVASNLPVCSHSKDNVLAM